MQPASRADGDAVRFPGARAPERTRSVDARGVKIAVYEWGEASAPPLLLLHGGFDFARTFDVFAPLLAAGGWRVVSWDQRGHRGCNCHQSRPGDPLADMIHVDSPSVGRGPQYPTWGVRNWRRFGQARPPKVGPCLLRPCLPHSPTLSDATPPDRW